jgi:hypothetical protein
MEVQHGTDQSLQGLHLSTATLLYCGCVMLDLSTLPLATQYSKRLNRYLWVCGYRYMWVFPSPVSCNSSCICETCS